MAIQNKETEKLVEEFFKRRFPDKDLAFEKRCGYFGVWVNRIASGRGADYMDDKSLAIWEEMKREDSKRKEIDNYHEEEAQLGIL